MTRAVLLDGEFPPEALRFDEIVSVGDMRALRHVGTLAPHSLSADLVANDYVRIQEEIERRWRDYCAERDDFSALFSYFYFVIVGPLVYWELLAKDYLRSEDDNEVVVVGSFPPSIDREVVDLPSFLFWARSVFWSQELSGRPVIAPAGFEKVPSVLNLREFFVESMGLQIVAWRAFRRVSRRRSSGKKALGAPIVLVVSQWAKSFRLRRDLQDHFVVEYVEEVIDEYRPGCLAKPIDLAAALDVFAAADLLADALVEEARASAAAAMEFVEELRPIAILTDHEYDPLIRFLIANSMSEYCPPIALIPEGAQTLLHPSVRRFFDNWALGNPRVFRFSLTSEEAIHALEGFHQEGAISGYLGNTTQFSVGLSKVVRLLLRAGKQQPLALINVDLIAGALRPSTPTDELTMSALHSLVHVLHDAGWDCALTCKNSEEVPKLRRLYGSRRTSVHHRCPWQMLALASDVVIQRDSSIGPEARLLGVPAVAWNPFKLPLASQGEVARGEIVLAEDESQLRSVLVAILERQDESVPLSNTDTVGEWLRRVSR